MDPQAYVNMAQNEANHWWFVARRRILADQLAQLPPMENRRILEVGCGTGGNLEMLKKFGHVSAIEMDERARAYAIAAAGTSVDIRSGQVPDHIPFESKSFDLICMLDVLEHIERDEQAINALAPLLAPNGVMLITVPAYQWLWSHHDEFLHHKRRYTSGQLRTLFTKCDMRESRLTYFNTLLFPLVALARLIQPKESGNGRPPGLDTPSLPINSVLRSVFGSESRILNHVNLPFGVSLYALIHTGRSQPAL